MHWLQTLLISDFPENPNLCYKWTKGGGNKTSLKGGKERYVCAGCRKIKDAKQARNDTKLPSRIRFGGERRKVQAELVQGTRETVASARVRIDVRVAQKYNDVAEETREGIRDSACGNTIATRKAIFFKSFKENYKSKRFSNVRTLTRLANVEYKPLWLTLRGRLAPPNSLHSDEMLMRYLDEELALFSSPRLLSLLKKSYVIVADGTFKASPKGIYQVVQANFDFEPASVQAFSEQFPAIAKKMCVFHVLQALNRRIQKIGLDDLYVSLEPEGMVFQRFIRMIGAHQFCPPNYTNRSIQMLQRLIEESELEVDSELGVIPPDVPSGLIDY
uniref:MULE transposase domain-containing protein n=1 Tax=Globodera rostochiensis TaxID=31243 RepID=A0A914HVF1_GLORO